MAVRSTIMQSNKFVSWERPKIKQETEKEQMSTKLFEDLKLDLKRIASQKTSFNVNIDSSQVLTNQFKKDFKRLIAFPDYETAKEVRKDFDRIVLSFLHQAEGFCSQTLEKLDQIKTNLG